MTKRNLNKIKRQRFVPIPPIAFLHKHRHIAQTPYEEELGGKEIKDGTMLIISFSQYEWTESLTDVPIKIIINDILTPFIVSSNAHITDVLLKVILIKEALTDFPLLIIKENINCCNFLNNDRFNFLTDRINYNSLTDFPIIVINERLYGEALFHIFLQNERYSIAYRTNRIMIAPVNILNSSHSNTNRLYHDYSKKIEIDERLKSIEK